MEMDKIADTREIVVHPVKASIPEPEQAIERSFSGGTQLGGLTFHNHAELIDRAREIAKNLADIIEQAKLYSNIQGRKFVKVEGWTTLGAMVGISPVEESSIRLEDGSYEATVKLVRQRDGMVIGRASAVCGMDEIWGKRPDYQRKSMAATRATGKAYRLGLSWVVVLAGYDPTPAEEMDGVHERGTQEAANAVAASKTAQKPPESLPNAPRNVADHNRTVFAIREVLAASGPVYRVSGFLALIRPQMVERCFAWPCEEPQHKGSYIITEEFWPAFQQLCAENQISIVATANMATTTSSASPETDGGAVDKSPSPRDTPTAPRIEAVTEKKTKKNQPYLIVKWSGNEWFSFHKDLNQHIKAGLPAQFQTSTEGKYKNIVGAFFIGNQKFDKDSEGFLTQPIIQRKEQ